ncbi:MAG: hypothetical protein HC880_06205, partial [Bacteroidia bacterium]|nr:hypothetical protein [Bacteroidia bacterium]
MLVIRTDENLSPLPDWPKEFSNIADGRGQVVVRDVKNTGDLCFIIVGYFDYDSSERDAFVLKIDENGNQLWVQIYNTPNDEIYNAVIVSRELGDDLSESDSYEVGGTSAELINNSRLAPHSWSFHAGNI